MPPLSVVELGWAGVALVAAVAAGITAHELSHALALTVAGVRYRVRIRPDRARGQLGASLPGAWVTVTPTAVPEGVAPWHLRVAAMMPLCLAVPATLVLAGLVPDPVAGGGLPVRLAAVGWLGCALPSPRDFSLLWYPGRALARSDAAPATDA